MHQNTHTARLLASSHYLKQRQLCISYLKILCYSLSFCCTKFDFFSVCYDAKFWFQEKNDVDNTPVVLVVAEQCYTEPTILHFSHFLLLSYQMGGGELTRSWEAQGRAPKHLGRDRNKTDDFKWPKGYSMPYDITQKESFERNSSLFFSLFYCLGPSWASVSGQ